MTAVSGRGSANTTSGASSMNGAAGPRHGFGCNCAWCLQGVTGPACRRMPPSREERK